MLFFSKSKKKLKPTASDENSTEYIAFMLTENCISFLAKVIENSEVELSDNDDGEVSLLNNIREFATSVTSKKKALK